MLPEWPADKPRPTFSTEAEEVAFLRSNSFAEVWGRRKGNVTCSRRCTVHKKELALFSVLMKDGSGIRYACSRRCIDAWAKHVGKWWMHFSIELLTP